MYKSKIYFSGAMLLLVLVLGSFQVKAQKSTKKPSPPKGRNDTVLIEKPFIETVDVGYTLRAKKDITGSVSTVTYDRHMKDLVNFSADNSLQGQVAGVKVMQTSAISAITTIRGISTFNAGTLPLYIIDGIPVKVNRFQNSLAVNVDNDPLSDIHPEDIASITVLKDADATSIYGIRGANGIILIKTNGGTSGKTYLDISAYSGVLAQPEHMSVLDTAQYRSYILEKAYASGMSQTNVINGIGRYLLLSTPNSQISRYNNNTDWQDMVLKNGITNNFHLTLRGGDAVAKYALNVGYTKLDGVLTNTDFSRFNLRLNLDYKVGAKLSFLNSIVYSRTDRKLSDAGNAYNTNPLYLATLKSPTLTAFQRDSTGATLVGLDSADYANRNNPYAVSNLMINKNNTNHISGKTVGQYTFSPHLNLRVGITFDYYSLAESRFVPAAGFVPTGYISRYAASQNSYELMGLNENVLNYSKTFSGKHSLNAFVGTAFQITSQDSKYARSINATSDQITTITSSSSTNLDSIGSISPEWKLASFFASANYAYNDKYLLGASFRADGSSRFQSQNQWGFFPAVSGGWRISKENFLKNSKFISDLKLRTSFGITGNSEVGFTNAFNAFVPTPYVYSAISLGILGNANFKWEQTQQFNAGLDLELAKGKFAITIDYYNKKTDHLYNIIQLPNTSGFKNYAVSDGAMSNSGVEAAFSWAVLGTGNPKVFGWQMKLNLAYNQNKVLALPARMDSVFDYGDYATILKPGVALGSFYGYNAMGVYAKNTDVSLKNGAANTIPFRGGDMIFEDVNKDGIIDENDKKVIGNVNPKIFGGFTNSFNYKNIELSVFMDFAFGSKIYNARRAALESMSTYDNQSTAVLRHWKNDGDITDMPRLTDGDPAGNSRFSSRWLEDGSYARFKAITLAYNLPLKGMFKGVFNNARILVTGQNLYTFSKYKGYSPDVANFANPMMYGVDYGNVPPLKSVVFGIQLGL